VSVADLAECYVHCGAIAREFCRDRWLAALFAPEPLRKDLYTLAAFAHEIERARQASREPLAGEMRLMWWLEAILGVRAAEAKGHPIAAALNATIEQHQLPKDRFETWLIAWRDDLYHQAADADQRGRELFAPLYALSAQTLGGEAEAAALCAGAAEALLGAQKFDEALAEILTAESALLATPKTVGPAFASLGALKLDARRGLLGKPPASLWRRQLAIWLWGWGR
jgi:phytoene synthase